MRIISRSSHEALSRCMRRYYWNYVYKGTGLAPRVTPQELAFGLSLHMGMEVLMKTGDINRALAASNIEADEQFVGHPPANVEQHKVLVEALIYGWWKLYYPTFMDENEILSIEKEGLVPLSDNIALQYRADVVVRSRYDSRVRVVNWKTMASSYNLETKFLFDIQMQSEALAVEKELGEPVVGCLVEGFVKGQWKYDRYNNPLIWAYRKPSGEPGEWIYSTKYERPSKSEPWGLFQTWKEPLPVGQGLQAWIDWMPQQTLAAQYARTEPIPRWPSHVLESWLRQVTRRERDVQHMLEEGSEDDRLEFFHQNFSQWNCNGCPFAAACGGETSIDDMLASGLLVGRVDHHAPKVSPAQNLPQPVQREGEISNAGTRGEGEEQA